MKRLELRNSPVKYGLENISIKEIIDKYPDKVMGMVYQGKNSAVIIPNGKIVFDKRIKREPSEKNLAKVLRNNKHN